MARIPEQFIDDLIARVDIVALIDQRVPLQGSGSEFKACCPFHNEKTPSFTVSPVKQFYHCFGCGAHGTAVGFLMNYDNLDFLDAIDTLAAHVGMTVPKVDRIDGDKREARNHAEAIIAQANEWYQAQLKTHAEGKVAIQYLKDRGLDGKTAANFGVGLAPSGWDNLIKAVTSTPEQVESLAQAGLAIKKDEGGYYDRFRARIMFPIEDYRGKLIGFGGRVLGEGEPKYLNSPETVLFHKGAELYGYHRARRAMGTADEAVVVEGYMDVVGLAQHGVDNAVATLGTATTPLHLQRLFRAASSVVFCFDGDRAGRQAAWRAMKVSLPEMQDGRQIKFLLMPEGEDPDSLIRQQGKDDFQQRLREATPLDTFIFDGLTQRLDLNQMDQRAKLAVLAHPLLQSLAEGNFKTMMFARLSELVGVTQRAGSISKTSLTQASRQEEPEQKAQRNKYSSLVVHALRLLIQNTSLVSIANEFEFDKSLAGMALFDQLVGLINSSKQINTATIVERYRDSRDFEILKSMALSKDVPPLDKQAEDFRNVLNKIEAEARQAVINNLLQKGLNNLNKQERLTLQALYKLQQN